MAMVTTATGIPTTHIMIITGITDITGITQTDTQTRFLLQEGIRGTIQDLMPIIEIIHPAIISAMELIQGTQATGEQAMSTATTATMAITLITGYIQITGTISIV